MTPALPATAVPTPDLIRQLRHRLAATRLAAVRSLAKLGAGAGETTHALSPSLNDDDDGVREAAARAIGQLGPEAVHAMARMLGNKDKYVRRHAVWGLGRIGPKAVAALVDLCRALKDADPRTATGAAQAIGEMGEAGAPAVADLAEAMRGTNVVLCRLAAKALSMIGPPALPTLLAHLGHHDPFVKGEAAMAVGWMGPVAAASVGSLADILRLPSPFVAPAGPSDDSAPPSTVDVARAAAATALGRIGGATAWAVLKQFERDPCPPVRDAVEMSLRQLRTLAA
jgi:HEAT repeat protein